MTTSNRFVRTTVAASLATLAAFAGPAHAGLLGGGGGGSLGGGLGGSIGGGLGQRTIDLGARASQDASIQRDRAVDARATDEARANGAKAIESGGNAKASGATTMQSARGSTVQAAGSAQGAAQASADKGMQQVGEQRDRAAERSSGVMATARKDTSISADGHATGAARRGNADVGAAGNAQAQRGERSVTVGGAASGSAERTSGESATR